MKKNVLTILAGILFLAGMALLLYPSVSNHWNAVHQTRVVEEYTDSIEELQETERQQMLKEAEIYNRMLSEGTARFFPSVEETEYYRSLLNMDLTGVMGTIKIPAIKCELPIYHGVEDSVLQIGIGHLEGSSLPTGGESTHCVLSGHRGLPSARLFTDLDKLEKGDIFEISVWGRELTYEIERIQIVEPEDYESLEIEEEKDFCTLLTCTPYGINTQRLLVRGQRVEQGRKVEGMEETDTDNSNLTTVWIVGIMLVVCGWLLKVLCGMIRKYIYRGSR